MSDHSTNDQSHESEDQSSGEGETNAMRQAREAAERNASEARALRKENAFLKAGVPTDHPVGQMLFDSYNGEMEPEAIKARWDEISATLQAPQAGGEEGEGEPPADAGQSRDRADLAGGTPGGAPPPPPDRSPYEEGMSAFQEAMAGGASRRQAGAQMISRVIDAGARGDERVVWEGWTDEELAEAKRS